GQSFFQFRYSVTFIFRTVTIFLPTTYFANTYCSQSFNQIPYETLNRTAPTIKMQFLKLNFIAIVFSLSLIQSALAYPTTSETQLSRRGHGSSSMSRPQGSGSRQPQRSRS